MQESRSLIHTLRGKKLAYRERKGYVNKTAKMQANRMASEPIFWTTACKNCMGCWGCRSNGRQVSRQTNICKSSPEERCQPKARRKREEVGETMKHQRNRRSKLFRKWTRQGRLVNAEHWYVEELSRKRNTPPLPGFPHFKVGRTLCVQPSTIPSHLIKSKGGPGDCKLSKRFSQLMKPVSRSSLLYVSRVPTGGAHSVPWNPIHRTLFPLLNNKNDVYSHEAASVRIGAFLTQIWGESFHNVFTFFFFRKSTIKPVDKGEVTQLCRLQRCSAIIQTRDRPTGSLHFLRDTNASPLDVVVQA